MLKSKIKFLFCSVLFCSVDNSLLFVAPLYVGFCVYMQYLVSFLVLQSSESWLHNFNCIPGF